MQLSALAQPLVIVPSDSSLTTSVDSLIQGLDELKQEREKIYAELKQLNSQLLAIEDGLSEEFSSIELQHEAINRHLEIQFDTLRALIPDEEPFQTAALYIRYLNQRQDSLISYVERLEERMEELPNNHYWGIRNNFKEFDHLLLFTFLGAIMSLGLVLLLRGDHGTDTRTSGDQISEYLKQEDKVDRLSISITLLVGSILVLLFIIFIL